MIFDKKIHDFNKFILDWSPNEEYVLFGASKECVQFIRTMDKLLGDNVLKIKYIVDHDVESNTIIEDVNQISTYYHQSKEIQSKRKGIKIINIKDFDGVGNVIITTDEFRKDYKKYLEEHKIKHTWYKNIAAIWPFILENKTHIFQTDVLVTEICNLNCSYCNMFIPHYQTPKHKEVKNILSDIDLFFSKIDYVSVFHLVGGEPFLHPNIYDIIDYVLKNYNTKIDKLIITSNGTVLPKNSILELLKNSNVILSISNYSKKLTKLENKVNRVLDTYKTNGINHYVRNEIEWYDFGDLRIKKNLPTDELINHFDDCTAPFRGLNDGKFYYCHLNTSAVLTKLFPLNENDYVDIKNVSNEDLLKFDLGFTPLGYVTFCDNCNGCNTGIKIPVSYEHQGLRK